MAFADGIRDFFEKPDEVLITKQTKKSERVLDHHTLNIEDVHRFIRMSEQIPGAVPVLCGVKSAWYTTEDPADLRNITPYYHNHQRVSDLHGGDDETL